MKEFKKILFPVDLSDVSEKIIPCIQMMANKFKAQIHLLFAARVFDHFTSIYVPHPSINQFQKQLFEGAEKRMHELVNQHFSQFVNTQAIVRVGDPAEEIIKYIEEQEIDLVIMGTHGRKGMNKILFGSVADRVVKNSPVAVMVVNPYRTV